MSGASGGDISTWKMVQAGFKFGDSHALCDRLLELVRSGVKAASCGALDWDGKPALLIETTEVVLQRFCDVPEDFALAEGESDFDDWKRGHIAYFTRNGGYDPKMMLVCARFRLIEVLA